MAADNLSVVCLAGGVGGARMAHGLAQTLPHELLTVIVNVGDDFDHFGLRICPDLDTVVYTLAGRANFITGWGRADETWESMQVIEQLGGPGWFRLGDRDLGLHLERTRQLSRGQRLSQVTQEFCRAWGITVKVIPATDDNVPTMVSTGEGDLPFQDYFVRRACLPKVTGFNFVGVENARPAPGVLASLVEADLVIICPSNPWVSIDPILSIPGLRQALVNRRRHDQPVAAVSPIIGGKTIKGPAAKMYAELGKEPSAQEVARHYRDLITHFFLDIEDIHQVQSITSLGISAHAIDIIMKDIPDRKRLAEEILHLLRGSV